MKRNFKCFESSDRAKFNSLGSGSLSLLSYQNNIKTSKNIYVE